MTDTPTFASETPKLFPVHQMDLGLIEVHDQIRKHFDPAKLQELGESIKEHGLVQPIVVMRGADGKNVLIAGERRLRAAQGAGISSLPAIVREDLSDQDAAVLQAIENLQRENLSPDEECAGVSVLVRSLGFDQTCKKLGKSPAWVSKRDQVKDLPDEVRSLITSGKVSDLEIALALGELKKCGGSDFTKTLAEYSQENEWMKPPTREQLRERLRWAKKRFEEKEKEKAKQKAEAERIKANPKLAEKLRKEKEKAKAEAAAAGGNRKAREKRCAELEQEEKRVENELLSGLLALAPGDWSKTKNRNQLPISVRNQEYFNAWGSKPLPASIESCNFHVSFDGHIDTIEKPLNLVAPGATVNLEIHDLTQSEAKAIEKLLGRKFAVTASVAKLTGKKIRALLVGSAPAQKPSSAEKQGDLSIGSFIAQALDRSDKNAQLKATDFHAAYEAWCAAAKIDPLAVNDNRYADAIEAAGIKKHRHKTGRIYLGVRLKA